MRNERHTPVLVDSVVEVLGPRTGESFLDLTAGYGGHAAELLDRVGENGQGYLIDQDSQAVAALKERFRKANNVKIIHANFEDSKWQEQVPPVDMVLMDLGVSSAQLETADRGFSFLSEARLDMRMNREQKTSAYEIVNSTPERELADIIYGYGEERRSRQIARAIGQARRVSPIETTKQLALVVAKIVPRRGKIHPATKTFQAIRIAVNDEIGKLERTLPGLPLLIKPGGRIAIISFHSLEDRRVKQFFRELARDKLDQYGQVTKPASFRLVTKKAVLGSVKDRNNPRARSAKLRAVEHIK